MSLPGPARSVLGLLQAALYTRLSEDEQLVDELGWGVYDQVPEDASYPYIGLGEAFETPDNDLGSFGRNVLLVLHLWSRYQGYAQATEALDRVVQLLEHQSLEITGHRVISVHFVDAQTVPDPDPTIRHAPVRFRALTEQA